MIRDIAMAVILTLICIVVYLFARWAVAFCAAFFVAGSI